MISLYRIRDNGMIFVVNATADTVLDLERRGVQVRQNKQTQFYDQTHWFSVRDSQEHNELRQLVISHYRPPQIDVLQFALSIQLDNRPVAYWRDYIKDELAKSLQVEKNSRKLRCLTTTKKVEAFTLKEYVVLDIWIESKSQVYLQIDFTVELYYQDQRIELKELNRYTDGQIANRIANEYSAFTTWSSAELFEKGKIFIGNLPSISLNGQAVFPVKTAPVSIDTMNFETWIWAHDYPIEIEFGHELFSDGSAFLFRGKFESLGFFALPAQEIVAVLIYPGEEPRPDIEKIKALYNRFRQILSWAFASTVDVKSVRYSVNGDVDGTINEMQNLFQNSPNALHLPLLLTAPFNPDHNASPPHIASSISAERVKFTGNW